MRRSAEFAAPGIAYGVRHIGRFSPVLAMPSRCGLCAPPSTSRAITLPVEISSALEVTGVAAVLLAESALYGSASAPAVDAPDYRRACRRMPKPRRASRGILSFREYREAPRLALAVACRLLKARRLRAATCPPPEADAIEAR